MDPATAAILTRYARDPREVIERIRSLIAVLAASFLAFGMAFAQQSLSIATGGTGGIRYPTGHTAAAEVAAEVHIWPGARPVKAPRTTAPRPPARDGP